MAQRFHNQRMVGSGRKSSMIAEDRSAACLLPTHIIEKDWNESGNYHMKYVDTLFNGISKQMREDEADFAKAFGPRKY